MEPVSAVVLSLALGAAATAGKEAVSAVVKDAYSKLKALFASKYPEVSVQQIERSPESQSGRAVVEKDLTILGASHDADLLAAAHELSKAIQQYAPGAPAALGVNLEDVAAANLRLADIAASGLGVNVERGTFTGDIDIRGVRAGVVPTSRENK